MSEYGITLQCRQISPFIPHEYKDSSLPCSVFVWTVDNVCDKQRKVSITFTFKNGTGTKKQDQEGNPTSELFNHGSAKGVTIKQKITDMQCNYSIGTRQSSDYLISYSCQFDATGNGESIWGELKQNCSLPNQEPEDNAKGILVF